MMYQGGTGTEKWPLDSPLGRQEAKSGRSRCCGRGGRLARPGLRARGRGPRVPGAECWAGVGRLLPRLPPRFLRFSPPSSPPDGGDRVGARCQLGGQTCGPLLHHHSATGDRWHPRGTAGHSLPGGGSDQQPPSRFMRGLRRLRPVSRTLVGHVHWRLRGIWLWCYAH